MSKRSFPLAKQDNEWIKWAYADGENFIWPLKYNFKNKIIFSLKQKTWFNKNFKLKIITEDPTTVSNDVGIMINSGLY